MPYEDTAVTVFRFIKRILSGSVRTFKTILTAI